MTITIPVTDTIIILLICTLTVILTIYNRRQADALRGMERLVEDFVAMQFRDRRQKAVGQLQNLDPLEWFSRQVSQGLEKPLEIADTPRVVREINAAEFLARDGRKVAVSSRPPAELKRYDARQRSTRGRGAAGRVDAFASRPLLGKKYLVVERALDQNNEFFDVEAGAVGERLGLDWGNPIRLWFYVAER